MRFMIIRRADADTEAGVQPSQELIQAMVDYHEAMGRDLKVIGGNGLHPTARGARVAFNNGKPTVLDGPFAETKELIAGYTLVEAGSLAQVVAWAQRWPAICGESNVQLEVREVFEYEDLVGFTSDLQAEARRIGLGT